MAINDEILFLLEIRLFCYSVLKCTFISEPSLVFLKSIKEEKLIDIFPFVEEDISIKEGVTEVSNFLKNKDILDKEEFETLHWDYTRMFIGPSSLIAPPWESAYRNEERLLFQEETMEVRRAYLKYSFISENYTYEPDDHIGLELDFMFQLCSELIERYKDEDFKAVSNILKDQENFLKNHILKWVDSFAKDIVEGADTEFYKGMAKILRGYTRLDLKITEQLLSNM